MTTSLTTIHHRVFAVEQLDWYVAPQLFNSGARMILNKMLRHYTAIISASLLCCIIQGGTLSAVKAQSIQGTVISITDGDTVIVAHDGVPEKIRLVNIDSPEKSQAFGRAAKKYLSQLVYMQEVSIERTGKDRYGRTLANMVRSDGTNINQELVRAGYAWVYRGRSPKADYKALENEAKEFRRGLWTDPNAIAPWLYRKQQRDRNSRKNPVNVADPNGLIDILLRERTTTDDDKSTK